MSSRQYVDSSGVGPADFASTLEIRPRPSRLLARVLLGLHLLAAVAVLLGVSGKWGITLLLLAIAGSYYYSYRRHVLQRGRRASRRVICQPDGTWVLQDQAGVLREARLLPSSYLHPRLVILNFDLAKAAGRRNLVLCHDSLDVQTLRQLRARLRLSSQA